MIRRFINRDSGAGSEGGSAPEMSLAELEALEDGASGVDPVEDKPKIEEEPEGSPAPKLEEEIDKAAKDEKPAKEKEVKEPKEVIEDDPAPEDEDEGPTGDEAEVFFTEVNELRGDALEVDYGDIDPLSPAGIVLRDSAVEDLAIEKFEKYLETAYPKAYGFLHHAMAGLPEDEYFAKSYDLDALPTEDQLLASLDIQQEIVAQNLIAKGNSEKHAVLIIKQLMEDGELEEASLEALADREQSQKQALENIKAETERVNREKNDAINEMGEFIDDFIATGKVGNVVIPEPDRRAFATEFKKSVRYEGGKFLLVTELNDNNVSAAFAKEYYSFKKGDLGKLVRAEAKTQNAVRLKRTVLAKETPKGGASSTSKFMTLGEMDAE